MRNFTNDERFVQIKDKNTIEELLYILYNRFVKMAVKINKNAAFYQYIKH